MHAHLTDGLAEHTNSLQSVYQFPEDNGNDATFKGKETKTPSNDYGTCPTS